MMTEKIRMVMVKRKMKGIDLASAMDCSSQNVYALLKKDNWCEKDLQSVAEKLNCDLEINLVLRDTGEKF